MSSKATTCVMYGVMFDWNDDLNTKYIDLYEKKELGGLDFFSDGMNCEYMILGYTLFGSRHDDPNDSPPTMINISNELRESVEIILDGLEINEVPLIYAFTMFT